MRGWKSRSSSSFAWRQETVTISNTWCARGCDLAIGALADSTLIVHWLIVMSCRVIGPINDLLAVPIQSRKSGRHGNRTRQELPCDQRRFLGLLEDQEGIIPAENSHVEHFAQRSPWLWSFMRSEKNHEDFKSLVERSQSGILSSLKKGRFHLNGGIPRRSGACNWEGRCFADAHEYQASNVGGKKPKLLTRPGAPWSPCLGSTKLWRKD